MLTFTTNTMIQRALHLLEQSVGPLLSKVFRQSGTTANIQISVPSTCISPNRFQNPAWNTNISNWPVSVSVLFLLHVVVSLCSANTFSYLVFLLCRYVYKLQIPHILTFLVN